MARQTRKLLVGVTAAALTSLALYATYWHGLNKKPETERRNEITTGTVKTLTDPDVPLVAGAVDEPLPVTIKRIQPTDAAPMPRRVSIQLSEEPAAEIEVRPYRMPSIARPQRLADIYPRLREMAEAGDASAAYGLHRWLSECEHAFADSGSLDKAIDKLRNEGVMTFPSSSALTESDRRPTRRGANAAAAETAMTQVYAFCDGITPAQKEEAPAWLIKAASSNELFALRAQADQWLKAKDRNKFTAAYEDLWLKHGYTGALSPLAVMYKRGVNGSGPDYLRSYAYQLTEVRLVKSVYGDSAFPSHRNMIVGMENALSNTASYLSPQQTADAVRLADQMLRNNRHCCVGLLFGATYE